MKHQEYDTIKGKHYKHFQWTERLKLEHIMKYYPKTTQKELAAQLNRHRTTIARELQRGKVRRQHSELFWFDSYSADIAQKNVNDMLQTKGPHLKIDHDFILAQEISRLIRKEKFSPNAVVMFFNNHGWPTATRISTRTLYQYIDMGCIEQVSRKQLPRGKTCPHKRFSSKHRHSRLKSAEKSISFRPQEVLDRLVFGHWEIDCMVSGAGKGTESLLTLTERTYRYEIIRKIPRQSARDVQKVLNSLERELGARRFREIFKTITADNGSEFMRYDLLEKSCINKRTKRTTLYYAHPYSSWERGSNERMNGMIRRFIPKGSAIKHYSKQFVMQIQEWLNSYPRRILGGLSSREAMGFSLGV